MEKQAAYNDTINKINMMMNSQASQNTINEQSLIIQQLIMENNQIKDQVKYLENKIKLLLNEKIQEKMKEKNMQSSHVNVVTKHIELSNSAPNIV
jgi:hypothetical protein